MLKTILVKRLRILLCQPPFMDSFILDSFILHQIVIVAKLQSILKMISWTSLYIPSMLFRNSELKYSVPTCPLVEKILFSFKVHENSSLFSPCFSWCWFLTSLYCWQCRDCALPMLPLYLSIPPKLLWMLACSIVGKQKTKTKAVCPSNTFFSRGT